VYEVDQLQTFSYLVIPVVILEGTLLIRAEFQVFQNSHCTEFVVDFLSGF